MIEMLCTLAGLVAGVVIVASLTALKQEESHREIEHTIDSIDSAKIRGIARQLQTVSQGVFDDVSNHTARMTSVGDSLVSGDAGPEAVLAAIDEIVRANQTMQSQLEAAQKQLAQQSELIEQTSMQARTDTLTGLHNRLALEEHLHETLSNRASDKVVGLLLLDIDHFKRFNDTYGHLAGDAVLACFARSIAQACGPNAFPCRYGGEEFAVVIRGDSETEVALAAASIRRTASESKISHEDLELTVTASAGLCIAQAGDDLTTAYERADEGLYQAKAEGRNRGLWLNNQSWELLPESATDPSWQPTRASDQKQSNAASQNETPVSAESIKWDESSESVTSPIDLGAFVEKVGEHLQQLHHVELPAGCFMIEAIFDDQVAGWQEGWHHAMKIAQTRVRGIDVFCEFRPRTMCIFLPGCSASATTERAVDTYKYLTAALATWTCPVVPTRFAVCSGHVLPREQISQLLDRIEHSLDECKDVQPGMIGIHNGHETVMHEA